MLSSDNVKETLGKITGLPIGLFEEPTTRSVGGLTVMLFECPVESDEYEVLINSKDEIVQVKNGYATYGKDLIHELLNPPVQPATPNSINTGLSGVHAVAAASISQSAQTQMTNNMPSQTMLPNLMNNIVGLKALIDDAKAYTAAYIQANPGCVYSLFDPTNPQCVNEASAAIAAAWEFTMIDMDGNDMTISLEASNASDRAIAGQVTSVVQFNLANNTISAVSIEG